MCKVEGCSRKTLSRGWCSVHYGRWYRTGDPTKVLRTPRHPSEREECKEEGCTHVQQVKGRCARHFRGGKWCSIRGCHNPSQALTLCRKHYGEQYRREQLQQDTARNFAVQRTYQECSRCEKLTIHLELIPKIWGRGELEYLCFPCGGVRQESLRPLAEGFRKYEDWYGHYNYSEEGELLRWNRSTSERGRGRL